MSEEQPTRAAATSNQGSRFRWPHAVALVAIVLAVTFLTCATMGLRSCTGTVEGVVRGAEALANAFRPNVSATTVIDITFTEIRLTPKFVVCTIEMGVEVLESKTTLWVFGSLNMGTTEVRIKASGNKGQYYIPTNRITVKNFEYDNQRSVLTFRVPHPVFDEDVVDVQSDPEKIWIETSVGWASLDSFEGEDVRNKAKSKLRETVIAEGSRKIHQAEVRERARRVLLEFLEPLAKSLKDGVKLEIEFDNAPVRNAVEAK